ncbi:hypothetical protein L211DRAFT_852829 [Terfezia boudieri ATCC MYA-4762]|uniref:Uncharacterized protein n=1 Tax=Terfezia boudieri ATCC MYA-4762 TaxID=1051890 RepID=A0A3N4LEE4_9PEZI|nr:hypothetical protein L211DRAFT_852829 [Terfezia boudieri ATCC MYA-4762]
MASRIVRALKNAKSSLRSHDIAVEEPEIVAVIPPPQDPKRSQPPPTPPAAKQQYQASAPPPPPSVQLQLSPPLSPVVQKLEETKLSEVPGFFLAELPDTSIARPRSQDGKEKNEGKSKEAPGPPVEEVKEGGEEHVGDEGAKGKGLGKELKEKKKKDPAVLVEAYEVAHSQKLQDQYFNPVFEDESRTPRDGASPPSPEKVAETLSAVAGSTVAS